MIHRARCDILKTSYGTIFLDSGGVLRGLWGLSTPPPWVKSLDFMGFQAPTGAEPPFEKNKSLSSPWTNAWMPPLSVLILNGRPNWSRRNLNCTQLKPTKKQNSSIILSNTNTPCMTSSHVPVSIYVPRRMQMQEW